jgi:hypothetical protein
MAGRPKKITEEKEKHLLTLLQAGMTKREACAVCGISPRTLERYQADSGAFVASIEKAEAEAAAAAVLAVRKALQAGTWTAAAWWLERRRPQEWGKVERVEASGPGGGPIQHEHHGQVDIKLLTDDELRSLDETYDRALARASQNGAREKEPA